MDLWIILLTGLTVGGLTCLAVQGGLLASVIAAREDEEVDKNVNTKNPIIPTGAFLVTKLAAHVALGFVLGAFGGALNINQGTQVIMQFLAGLYMVAIALNLLNVHPIFRYAVIQPPRFLMKKVKSQSKSKDLFAPAVLGAMTIFIPCGTTLAMEALAISSGTPLNGALIMGTFVLGTMPLFFGIGWLTSILGDTYREKFLKIAALAVLYLGLSSVNGALLASGFPFAIRTDALSINKTLPSFAESSNGTQNISITVTTSGYEPKLIQVKKNVPVKLSLTSTDAYSCASAFRIPSLGISRNLQPNDTEIIEFTPTQAGPILFTCSMGMYSGTIDVI